MIEQRKAEFVEKLQREFGDDVNRARSDQNVIEIMANPDGRLWLDTLSHGIVDTGIVIPPTQITMAIRTIATYYDRIITAESPRIQAEIPLTGERFQGLRPPLCEPSYVIRKHLPRVFSMAEMVANGTVTPEQATILLAAIRDEKNILTCGATMSGKTVLLDTVIYETSRLHGVNLRIVVIEDTLELHVEAANKITLRATETETMRTLVHTAMRLRPDRLIVGEVRGAEALEMLKSWATGHGGSACTIHAGSPDRALRRLKAAVQEAGVPADLEFIGEVVDLIVMMKRRGPGQWGVEEIVACEGWENGRYLLHRLDTPRKEVGYVNGVTTALALEN